MLDKSVFLTPNGLDKERSHNVKNQLVNFSNWGNDDLQENLDKLKQIVPWGENFGLPSRFLDDLGECPDNARKGYISQVNDSPLSENMKKKLRARTLIRGEFILFLSPSYFQISFLSLPNPFSPNHNFIYICEVKKMS